MEIANVVIEAANAGRAAEVQVRVGADVVLTVREAPPDGGRGIVSLAGLVLRVRLPAGLEPGQTLMARIVEATPEQLVLRLHPDGASPPAPSQPHAAGALAVAGDPDLLRAAIALTPPGLALPLPNGDAVALTVQDEGRDEGPAGEDAEAAFVLHSAELGPIEVRVRLGGGAVSAEVVVDETALPLARSSSPQLAAALEAATGVGATVGVTGRAAAAPRPAQPKVAEGLDAYA